MTVSVKRRPLQYSHTVGALALTGRGFSNPVDLALGENGMMYVINRSNSFQAPQGAVRVTICTSGHDYVGQFGDFGTDDGQFIWPTAIARDSQGNLYVSDEHRHDVQKFDAQGNFLFKWGEFGSGDGQFDRPSGLAIDPDDNVIVVDHLNHRVQRFSPEGKLLASWGSQGSGPGELDMPWGVATDASGNVYVADWQNDRIQKFSPDGQYLASIGESGSGDGQLRRPSNLAVASDGTIYVADWGNERVVVFTPEGYPLTSLIGDSEMSPWGAEFLAANEDLVEGRKVMADGTPEKRFWGPTAVEVDEQGRVLVLESCRHRVQVYEHA
jgi:DNA-binding beta-propeller fold protein YncE